MKRKGGLLLFFCLAVAINVNGQGFRVGLSLGTINDIDWNRPLADFLSTERFITLNSGFPIKFGIDIQMDNPVLSPSFRPNIVFRNIRYSANHTPITNFNHLSLFVPFHINYKKPLDEKSYFTAHIGGGVNYLLTSADRTRQGMLSNDVLIYSFQITNPQRPGIFMDAGIGFETSIKNLGVFQFRIEYTHNFSRQLRYEYEDRYFRKVSDLHRISFFRFGITYYFLNLN